MKLKKFIAPILSCVLLFLCSCDTAEPVNGDENRLTRSEDNEVKEDNERHETTSGSVTTTASTFATTTTVTTVATTPAATEKVITKPADWKGMNFNVYLKNIEDHSEILDLPLVAVNNTYGNYNYITNKETEDKRTVSDDTYNNYNGNVFFIDKNNVLTGFGDNNYGQIGNGTGVDISKDEEPAVIMTDVANIYQFDDTIHAIKTDGSFWVWGNNNNGILNFHGAYDGNEKIIYEPSARFIITPFNKDPIPIEMVKSNYIATALSKTGELYIGNSNIKALPSFVGHLSGVKDYAFTDINNLYVIHGNGDLIHYYYDTDYQDPGYKFELLGTDVISFKVVGKGAEMYCHFIKEDNTLWAVGNNSKGMLGDGTKIDRDEPVKIADDAAEIYKIESMIYWTSTVYPFYLTTTGELWGWAPDKPTPEKIKDGVAAYYPAFNDYLYFDNTMKDEKDKILYPDVALPTEEVIE